MLRRLRIKGMRSSSNLPRTAVVAVTVLHCLCFLFVEAPGSLAKGKPVAAQSNSAPARQELGEVIARSARESLGKKMWLGYGLSSGLLGCAAAVSNVLKNAGVKDAHSAGVVMMRNQLMRGAHNYKEIILKNGSDDYIPDDLLQKSAQPGDILLAFMEIPSKPNLGSNAHCGIMGDGINVYTNDWKDGIWKYVNIHRMFESYRHIRLLRLLPEANTGRH